MHDPTSGHRHGHDDHRHDHDAAGAGHNAGPPRPVQWQTPHRPPGEEPRPTEPDFDLVEAAFAEGFAGASDPTSFLRLAGVPFAGDAPDGARLHLLRVALDQTTDVASVTPHLGGEGYRHDPLPARLVSRRRRLRFVYHDGRSLRALTLGEAKALGAVAA